jgi:hypothetical protein
VTLFVAALFGQLLGAWARGRAAEAVVVETASGRVFTGQIDHRTTSRQLVVRSGPDDMHLARWIEWGRVARVRIDGKPYTASELLARFDAEGWPRVAEELSQPKASTPRPPAPRPPGPSQAFDAEAAGGERVEEAWPVARSLHIEAQSGKWSGYTDNDGVVVRVFPLDANGNVVPVGGTLEVDLIGSQSASLTRGDPFPQLARWVERVDPRDVGSDGATYRLPFQAWHPDFDLQLGSLGAVHARLSVPGQGVFDDTASMVWVRPYSATRDRLQMHTGGRFFLPQERTSRGMNDSRSGVIAPP